MADSHAPVALPQSRASSRPGYKEKGNINAPLRRAFLNQMERFSSAIDVLDNAPRLRGGTAHLREYVRNTIISNLNDPHTQGTDRAEIADWAWPF